MWVLKLFRCNIKDELGIVSGTLQLQGFSMFSVMSFNINSKQHIKKEIKGYVLYSLEQSTHTHTHTAEEQLKKPADTLKCHSEKIQIIQKKRGKQEQSNFFIGQKKR